MHKLLPEIKVDYRKFSITAMKEMLSSGIWNSFNQASNILLTSLDLLVVPEKLRTLDHGRPWSDDQFASTRLSSNRDMSR